ncbi:MAG: disulfide bond formation protein B [Betaproteobacteria bacterium]|nr:MAG: disulfide bond formation protein B [Betaproteobacteria bacterium]
MRPRVLLIFGIVAPLLAVGAALFTQYRLEMQPCPWCVLQRVIFLGIALASALALAARKLGTGLGLLLSIGGIAAALWQHFVAAASASCNLTLADRIVSALSLNTLWPDVFEARASCADAAVALLGVPYEFWSLGLFVLLGAAMISAMRR